VTAESSINHTAGGAAATNTNIDRPHHLTSGLLAIALQSVTIGLGLSAAGMAIAAFGYLRPVNGALFQEVIDILVILNALRVLR